MWLNNFRILDLTRLMPGAYCTQLLADMGADVIKIEPPGSGDYMRDFHPLVEGQSALFRAFNRNKRSVSLNLKTEAGRHLLKQLVQGAAVLVEGNRPGTMDRLGLGWETLRSEQPNLVMCSISGYGQNGPFALRAGHDLNYMALAGALGLNSVPDGPPHPLAVQVADLGAGGMGAAAAILGALVSVERGGSGVYIDLSMTDGVVSWLTGSLAEVAASSTPDATARLRHLGRYPCYRVYRCADDRCYTVAAIEEKFWSKFCEAVGRPDLVDLQMDRSNEAHAKVETLFATHTRNEWTSILADLDVCCEPVLDLDEVSRHPQVVARRLIVETTTGVHVAPHLPLGDEWLRREAPELGQHTAEVLAEIGVGDSELGALRKSGVV